MKWPKYPSYRLVNDIFQTGNRKIFDFPEITASRRNPGAPENSAFTGFFTPSPFPSMSHTQHGSIRRF
jgi:hypothetical protein